MGRRNTAASKQLASVGMGGLMDYFNVTLSSSSSLCSFMQLCGLFNVVEELWLRVGCQ